MAATNGSIARHVCASGGVSASPSRSPSPLISVYSTLPARNCVNIKVRGACGPNASAATKAGTEDGDVRPSTLVFAGTVQINERIGATRAARTAITATGCPTVKLCPMNRVRNPWAPRAAAAISIRPMNNVAGPGQVRIWVVAPTGVNRKTT